MLEATAIFAGAAREAGTELVVNNSQFQGTAAAPSFRNLQHRLADRIFDWTHEGEIVEWADYYDGLKSRRTALAAHFQEWFEL